MRRKLGVLSLLLVGLFLTVGGAALAVTGPSGRVSASVSQYGGGEANNNSRRSCNKKKGKKCGKRRHGNRRNRRNRNNNNLTLIGSASQTPVGPSATGASARPSGASPTARSAQAPAATNRPVTLASKQLPFTGYAAIPLLVLGMISLTLGVLGRRRLEQDSQDQK